MTVSDGPLPFVLRADAENLNSHNAAELRRQYEERQQETEHVHELLENKIQLLQEVSGSSESPESKVLFPKCSYLAFSAFWLFSFLTLLFFLHSIISGFLASE